jgi:hypothetical protein
MSTFRKTRAWLALLLLGSAGSLCAHATQIPQQSPPTAQPAPTQSAGAFRISGIVVDAASGIPLAGVEVRATHLIIGPGGGNNVVGSDTRITIGDGRFEFKGLEAGRYQLSARKRGYPAILFQQHEGVWSAVIIGPGLEAENLVFQLHAAVVITGEVRDDAGDPVRGAQVMLYRENLANGEKTVQPSGQKQTNDQGRYRFSGLQPGVYFISVSAQPWYASEGAARMSQRITQRMISDISRNSASVSAVGNGEVPPEPDPLDVVYPLTFFPGATDSARASPLTLLPGEQATADFNLFAVPGVHLRVRLPAGGNQQGQFFNVNAFATTLGGQQVPLPMHTGMVEERGTVMEVIVPPGHLRLNINESQNGRQTAHWLQDVDSSQNAEISVAPQAANASVTGIVKPPGTAAMPRQCVISVRLRETGENHAAQIGEDGSFEIPQQQILRPGAYDVFLSNCPLYHVERVTSPTPSVKFSGRGFELAPGEAVRLIVELGAGLGRLDGMVLRDGKPASGVMVLMVPADGPVSPFLIQRNQSNTDGSFFWTAIRPGKYTLVAVDNLWNLEWAKPEVLKPLLAHGETIQIEPNGQHKVTLHVQ